MSADPRLDERSNVFLSASLHGRVGSLPVRVRNISPMGAMLDGARLPDEGSRVTLERGMLAARAEIVWQSGDFRGIRFEEPINVEAWVKRAGHAGQERVDQAIRALREGAPLAASDQPMEQLSLQDLSDELIRVCERMAASPALTVEMGEDVLKVESIALSLKRFSSTP